MCDALVIQMSRPISRGMHAYLKYIKTCYESENSEDPLRLVIIAQSPLLPPPATSRPIFMQLLSLPYQVQQTALSPQWKVQLHWAKRKEWNGILTNTSCLANARRRSIEALSLGCFPVSFLPKRLSFSWSSRSSVWSFLPAPLPCMVTKNFPQADLVICQIGSLNSCLVAVS